MLQVMHFDDARVLVVAVGVEAVGVVVGRHRPVGHLLRVPRIIGSGWLRTHVRELLAGGCCGLFAGVDRTEWNVSRVGDLPIELFKDRFSMKCKGTQNVNE